MKNRTLFYCNELLSAEELLDDFGDKVNESFEKKLFFLVFAWISALVVHQKNAGINVTLNKILIYELFFHEGEILFLFLKEKGEVSDSVFHFFLELRILFHELIELLAVLVNVEEEFVVGLGFDVIGEVFGNYQRGSFLFVLKHFQQFLLWFSKYLLVIDNSCCLV